MARRETSWFSAIALAVSFAGAGLAAAQPAAPTLATPPAGPPPASPSAAPRPSPSVSPSASPSAAPAPKPSDDPSTSSTARGHGSATASSTGADASPPKPKAKVDPATVLPPRPPTLPDEPPEVVPWERHIEVGPDLAFVTQPASHDKQGKATGVSYGSTFGFAAHATWQMLHHLQFSVYFVDSNHGLRFNPNALALPRQSQITSDSAHTYSFGGRFQPLIPFGENIRAWLSGGIGWARWDYPRMEVTTGNAKTCKPNTYVVSSCYMLYERADNMAVFPLGIGASFDVVPHRLALVIEFQASIPAFQSGTGVSDTRAVDDSGVNRRVGGLPLVDVMLVETVGLSALF